MLLPWWVSIRRLLKAQIDDGEKIMVQRWLFPQEEVTMAGIEKTVNRLPFNYCGVRDVGQGYSRELVSRYGGRSKYHGKTNPDWTT